MRQFIVSACLFVTCASLIGCASHSDRFSQARGQFYAGDLTAADQAIEQLLEKRKKERDVLLLDRSLVALAQGNPEQSERLLRQVRDSFDELEQMNLGEQALTAITDETQKAYPGEPYERVLIRVFLALSNLVQDGEDVAAYAWQIQQEQEEILEKKREAEPDSEPQLHLAIGPYLRGVLDEASHVHYADAERNYALAAAWQPAFETAQYDIERVRYGRHSEQGHGVVYVFALVGRGPRKEVSLEHPTSNALLIADRILSATGEHTLPPTIAPIKVPRVVRSPNSIDRVYVDYNGQRAGETKTITDVTALALAEGEEDLDQVVARAVARRVIKKGLVYTAKETTSLSENGLANFAMDAVGVMWEATETADTRCWGLLPDRIQVLRLELPVGTHTLQLQPASVSGAKGLPEPVQVSIEDGRNSYVLANFPSERLVGKVLSRTP